MNSYENGGLNVLDFATLINKCFIFSHILSNLVVYFFS